jgi:hypothetical protein
MSLFRFALGAPLLQEVKATAAVAIAATIINFFIVLLFN